jgi:hypothetical protein
MTFSHFSQYDQYTIGVDPGQAVDPTAIAIVRRVGGFSARQRFQIGHLERLPLGTPYPGIVWRVKQLLAHPTFHNRAEVVLDLTGVGRPVNDLFEGQGVRPICVTITAGHEEPPPVGNFYYVPKLVLISGVQALLHDGRLQIQSELAEALTLKSELMDFRAEVMQSGYWRFGARAGAHDDLVLAVALAVWRALSGGVDFGMWARLGGFKPPFEPDPDLVAGDGEVIVNVKDRVWLAGVNRWLEPGRQVMRAELAAAVAEHLS